jgi:hypothetical protein
MSSSMRMWGGAILFRKIMFLCHWLLDGRETLPRDVYGRKNQNENLMRKKRSEAMLKR